MTKSLDPLLTTAPKPPRQTLFALTALLGGDCVCVAALLVYDAIRPFPDSLDVSLWMMFLRQLMYLPARLPHLMRPATIFSAIFATGGFGLQLVYGVPLMVLCMIKRKWIAAAWVAAGMAATHLLVWGFVLLLLQKYGFSSSFGT